LSAPNLGLAQGRYQTSYSAKIALRHGEKAPIARRVFAASLSALISLLMLPLAATRTSADELYASGGVDLRWDNTLRYTTALRVSARDPAILANSNSDDGDRDFAPGIISNRLDLMSQLDLSQGDLGIHVSAAAWYDSVYHANTDNRSEATANVTAVSSTRFAPDVRNLYGQYAELDDAFLYDTVDVGDIPLSLRAGRQTVLWGESLFYDPNSIASAQAPTDYTRTIAGENSYSSNIYLPVTQLVLAAQLLPDVALTIYDQVEARASRQAGDGSYLSYVDFIGAGAGRLFLSSGQYLVLDNDGKMSASGQYGAALHASISGADFGFYALKFNARDPQIIETIAPDSLNPPLAGFYRLVFPKGITLYGASASTALGDGTVAGEISLRQNTPLLLYGQEGGVADAGARNYIKGDLFHAQASAQLPVGQTSVWDTADLSMEVAADDVTDTVGGTASPAERFAMKARVLIEPHYFQVLPNLDLTFPAGVGYNFIGHSFSYYAQTEGAGDFQIGVSALYRSAWKASLTMTGFIGSPLRQPLADRNFVAFSLERTF
jgi:hypothetical protein